MGKKSASTLINNMTEGPLTRQLIMFALPIMGANLLQALYTLVDLWAVGKFADSAAISAVSISSQLVILMHCGGIGLSNGGQILISQQVGANDTKNLSTTIGTLLSSTTLGSSAIALIGGVWARQWILLLNTPQAAQSGAINYLLICCFGAPFMCIGGCMCATLRGIGESKQPMFVLGVSAVTNMILDFVFVARFGWGAEGAALATVLAQVASAIYAVFYVYIARHQLGFDFRPASLKIHRATMSATLTLGAPLVIQTASITFSMTVISAFVNTYGVAASAITGIGSKLTSMVSVVTSGMQTAVASIVAQNFAAGRLDRVRKANRISFTVCMIFFIFVGFACLKLPCQIIGIFTQATETEVLAYAPQFMFISFWLYLAFCLMTTSLGHINGVGFTTYSLVMSLLDGVIGRIGLSLLLGSVFQLGVASYWWGNAFATYISVVMGLGYYWFGPWEKRKLVLAKK